MSITAHEFRADMRDEAIADAIKCLSAQDKLDYLQQWLRETVTMEGHVRRLYLTREPLGGAEIGVNLADEFNSWLCKQIAEDQNL